jgi:hypothetical protein
MNQRTAPHSASVLPVRLRRRDPLVTAGLLAATAVMVSGTGLGSAAAVDTPADPQLLVADECIDGVGPRLALVYTNPDGPGVANFETSVNGESVADVSVLPGGQQVLHVPVGEGTKPVIEVSANGGWSETITRGWTNCWDMQRWTGFECGEDGPVVRTEGTNTGLTDTLQLLLDGQVVATHTLAPGEEFSFEVALVEDASYDVKVLPGHSGWSSVTGHANCTEPEPEVDVPEVEPDVPEVEVDVPQTTTTTTPPAQVAGLTTEIGSVSAVAVLPNFTG